MTIGKHNTIICVLNTEQACKRSAVCTLFASFAPIVAAFCNGHYRYKSSAKSVVVCFQKMMHKIICSQPQRFAYLFKSVLNVFLRQKTQEMSDNFLPIWRKFKFHGSTTCLGKYAYQSRVFQFLIDGLSHSASIYRLAPCLQGYYDKNRIFPIWAILKHKQVNFMRRKVLFTIFKYLFSFQRYSSFFKICKLAK